MTKKAPPKAPSVVGRPNSHTLALVLMLGVVLGFATFTVVVTNQLRMSGAVDRMACAMQYGTKALLVVTDQFVVGGKAYDLSGQADRPSIHPLCLVPEAMYLQAQSKGDYLDAAGQRYLALDLALVNQQYNEAQVSRLATRRAGS